MVRAARARVRSGDDTDEDALLLAAHARRKSQTNTPEKRRKAKAANVAHDADVAVRKFEQDFRDRVSPMFREADDEGGSALKTLGKIAGALPLAANPAGLAGLAANAAGVTIAGKGASEVLDRGVGPLLDKAAENQRGAGLPKGLKTAGVGGSVNPVNVPSILRTPAAAVSVLADDPVKEGPRLAKDLAVMAKNAPQGVIQSIMDPAGALEATVGDYKRRYADDSYADKKKRLQKEGIAPEALDAFGLVSSGGTVATQAVGKIAKKVAPGGKVDRFINAPRPNLRVSEKVVVPQRKGKNLVTIAAQSNLDKRRARRVQKQTRESMDRQFGEVVERKGMTRRERDAVKQRLHDKSYGPGVRGVMPGDGEVVHLSAGRRGVLDRQAAAQRRDVAWTSSSAYRRLNRAKAQYVKTGEREWQALSLREQNAAAAVLEGLVNVKSPKASLAAVERELKRVEGEQARVKAENPELWRKVVAPAISAGASDLKVLRSLRDDLKVRPEKVLTPKLASFLNNARVRQRELAGTVTDSVSQATQLGRRYAPAGERLGSRGAYEVERQALELLGQHGDVPNALKAVDEMIVAAREGEAKRGQIGGLSRLRGAVQRVGAEVAEGGLDAARMRVAERFAARTQRRAEQVGLDLSDPVYFLHRDVTTGGTGAYTTGGAERGAVPGPKKSNMTFLRLGVRDLSDAAYSQGLMQSIKRSEQWRMVDELFTDHVPEWSKNNGEGVTWAEFRHMVGRQQEKGLLLDGQDWVAWTPKRIDGRHKSVDGAPEVDQGGDTGMLADGSPDAGGVHDLPDPNAAVPQWAETGQKFFVVPRAVMEEMRRDMGPATKIAREWGKLTSWQSQAILGSNPAYGVRQALQQMPVAVVQVGGQWVTPEFWRAWNQIRKGRKSRPRTFNEIADTLGFQSRSEDAVRTPSSGDFAANVRRQQTAFVKAWPALMGGSSLRDYLVSPRHSIDRKGDLSVAARTAIKTPFLPFKVNRDLNLMIDAWQDRLSRTMVLAATDARAARRAKREARAAGTVAKKTGPVAAAFELPDAEFTELQRSPEWRQTMREYHTVGTKFLGDFANYTQAELRAIRPFIPFYGFVRFSTKLLLHTLPLEHPVMLAAFLQLSGMQARERDRMLKEYAKREGLDLESPEMLAAKVITDNKLGMFDVSFLNPISGPALDAIEQAAGGGNALKASSGLMSPLTKALIEGMSNSSIFTGGKLSNAKGAIDDRSNPMNLVDTGRYTLSKLGQTTWPWRTLDTLLNKDKGKPTDTSLPWDFQPYPYKRKDTIEANEKRKRAAREHSVLDTILGQTVPLVPNPKLRDSVLSSAAYEGQRKAGKPKKKGSSLGGMGGGLGGGLGGLGIGP